MSTEASRSGSQELPRSSQPLNTIQFKFDRIETAGIPQKPSTAFNKPTVFSSALKIGSHPLQASFNNIFTSNLTKIVGSVCPKCQQGTFNICIVFGLRAKRAFWWEDHPDLIKESQTYNSHSNPLETITTYKPLWVRNSTFQWKLAPPTQTTRTSSSEKLTLGIFIIFSYY